MLRKTHLFIGILTLIGFALTGQYMDKVHNHLEGYDNFTRLVYRAGHIYILLFGLIHVVIGAYLKQFKAKFFKELQLTASLLFIVATLLLFISFFTEIPTDTIERPLARYAIYLALGSIITHGLLSFFSKEN